jgi:uncharacterized protein
LPDTVNAGDLCGAGFSVTKSVVEYAIIGFLAVVMLRECSLYRHRSRGIVLSNIKNCSHKELAQLLQSADADSSASEAHGMLGGTICAAGKTAPGLWLEYLLGEGNTLSAAASDSSDMLLSMQSELLRQLNDDAFGFELLLPPDDVPLPVRTEALSQWCAGFLYGLALGGFREDVALPDSVSEVVKDIFEISHARFDYEMMDESDESAYMEIVEYVRMSVLLLYEELQPLSATRLQ